MYFQIAKMYRQYNDIYIMRYIYVTVTQECGDFNLVLLKVNARSLVIEPKCFTTSPEWFMGDEAMKIVVNLDILLFVFFLNLYNVEKTNTCM